MKKGIMTMMLLGAMSLQMQAQIMTVITKTGDEDNRENMFYFGEEATITFSSGKMTIEPASGNGTKKTFTVGTSNTEMTFSQEQVEPVQLRVPEGQSYGVSTYVATNPLDISKTKDATDLTGYVLTSGTKTYVTAAKQMQIAAGDAFILRGEPGWYYLPVTEEAIPEYKNILQGSLDTEYTVKEDDRIYALSNYGEFWRVETGVSIPYKKAYYVAESGTQGALQSLSIVFEEDYEETMANGVMTVESNEASPAYNIAGQRVKNGAKGIVISSGKKCTAF